MRRPAGIDTTTGCEVRSAPRTCRSPPATRRSTPTSARGDGRVRRRRRRRRTPPPCGSSLRKATARRSREVVPAAAAAPFAMSGRSTSRPYDVSSPAPAPRRAAGRARRTRRHATVRGDEQGHRAAAARARLRAAVRRHVEGRLATGRAGRVPGRADGSLVTYGGLGPALVLNRQFGDFSLKISWKLEAGRQLGRLRRASRTRADDPYMAVNQGHEIQIYEGGQHRRAAEDGVDLQLQAGGDAQLQPDRRVERLRGPRQGPEYTVPLNGVVVNTFTGRPGTTDGYIGLQNHDANSHVHFRYVRIKAIETTPPSTTAMLDPAQPGGAAAATRRRSSVTLAAADNEGGSGVARHGVPVGGGAWTTYARPFEVGSATAAHRRLPLGRTGRQRRGGQAGGDRHRRDRARHDRAARRRTTAGRHLPGAGDGHAERRRRRTRLRRRGDRVQPRRRGVDDLQRTDPGYPQGDPPPGVPLGRRSRERRGDQGRRGSRSGSEGGRARQATGATGPQAARSSTSCCARSGVQRSLSTRCSASASTSSRAARAASRLGGEDQGVGGLADAVLLGGLELGGAEVVEGLDDPAVGLCAFRGHGVAHGHRQVRTRL